MQVRPPTFYQKCRDQEWYIQQLTGLSAQYQAQIAELKSQLPVPPPTTSSPGQQEGGASPKPPLAHPHPHPLPRLKSRNRAAAGLKSELVPTVECGPLSSSSDSEDGSSELDTADTLSRASLGLEGDEEEQEEFNPQSILSDLDSLTEPSLESVTRVATTVTATPSTSTTAGKLLEQLPVSLSSEPPCQERSINTALEDELMLLRLLELHGRAERSSGATSLDTVSFTHTTESPVRPSSARNPIVTAESIINTLQMEMATVGLTAAAITAATRHLDTDQLPVTPPTSHTIAPRPSLGRVDVVDPISSLPDNLASLLVSDQTPASSFSSLLTASPNTPRQSRLATMFSSSEPTSATPERGQGSLASLLGDSQSQLSNILGADISSANQRSESQYHSASSTLTALSDSAPTSATSLASNNVSISETDIEESPQRDLHNNAINQGK